MRLFEKTARLDALDLEVPLKFTESYHDDGYFDSMNDYFDFLDKVYGYPMCKLERLENLNFGEPLGAYVRIPNDGIIFNWDEYRVGYLKNDLDLINYFVRSHEETHFLDHTGNLGILSHMAKLQFDVDIDFSSINDSELRAHLGGIYCLDNRGILDDSQKELSEVFSEEVFEEIMKAYGVYMKAKAN